jgi:phenylalanyl-tRNA synthetase beta chain
MKLPLSWLREYVDVRVEPRKLGEDLTMAGLALEGIESDGKDAVLDLDVTTNRVDAMNVYGLAREVAVIYGLPLKPLDLSFTEKGAPASAALDVTIEAADLCPRFCARVLDVRMGPSPAWLRDRLEQMGVRPISNVVDLTNYVMLEMGQPSHAFDLAKVPAGRLNVRWAREGERLRTLDGVERTLHPRMGVVAGVDGPLALAGIMGGAASEVSDDTRAVALEAAFWEPLAIRRAARSLGMHTEASHRFERGADPEGTRAATARIAHLLEKIGGGTTRPGLIDRVAAPRPPRSVILRPARVRAVLGIDVATERAKAILTGLGFDVKAEEAGTLRLETPTWRSDVAREDDVVEEVGRHFGLDKIPSSVPPAGTVGGLRPAQAEERKIREILVGAGCSEVVNYAFEAATGEDAVALANPLAEDQSVLRTSLVPGLVKALDENARHGRRDVAIFEIGRVFEPATPRPREERHLGVLLAGSELGRHWSGKRREFDFYDLKGILELLFERLGKGRVELGRLDNVPAFLHPGQSAQILRDGRKVGFLGALRPNFRPGGVSGGALELDLDFGGELPARERFRALPRFPAVERDLSIVVDERTPASEVERQIREAAGPALVAVAVTDRYDRPPVPEGKVSLLLSLRYEDRKRTLTGEEVQASLDEVIRKLRAAGFDIRGE